MARLTVHAIRALKGKRQLTQVFTMQPEEAAAADAAGIDIIVTAGSTVAEIRRAAPGVFLVGVPSDLEFSDESAIRSALGVLGQGADAIYSLTHGLARIAAMAEQKVPVIGHVGYVPYHASWMGPPRAVGKTAAEALEVYRKTKALERAGAFGVEMELVPHRVAAEIARRTGLCVVSMGSGTGCDAQYLFAEDILGTNRGHVPRHAKRYRNLSVEYDRLRGLMTEAFSEFSAEVRSGAFPAGRHVLPVDEAEFGKFLEGLEG
jgi:3-methyl-2-oxobutanoate hydroxymethyltransferase